MTDHNNKNHPEPVADATGDPGLKDMLADMKADEVLERQALTFLREFCGLHESPVVGDSFTVLQKHQGSEVGYWIIDSQGQKRRFKEVLAAFLIWSRPEVAHPVVPPADPELLLPCPFCGSRDLTLDNLTDPDDWFVSCNGCEIQQVANYMRDVAIQRWNKRPAPSASRSLAPSPVLVERGAGTRKLSAENLEFLSGLTREGGHRKWTTMELVHVHQGLEKLLHDLARAEAELHQWSTWGVIEIALRNPNVSSYMKEWEERATTVRREALEEACKIVCSYCSIDGPPRNMERISNGRQNKD